MENNEILTNEEVMETTEEIVNASSGKGFTVKNVRTLKQTWRGQNAIFFLAPILMGKRSNSSHAAIRSFDANIETVAED